MKRLSIFRTMLVVASILLGTGYSIADEQIVWQGTFNENNVVSCGGASNYSFLSNSKLRIYIYTRNLHLYGSWGGALELGGAVDGYVSIDAYNESQGYFEVTLTSGAVNVLKQQGLVIDKTNNFNVSKVALVNSWGVEQDITSGSGSDKFSNVTASYKIRIYATFTNVGKLRFTTNWGSAMFNGRELVCTIDDAKREYTEIDLDEADINLWKNQGGMNIAHDKSGVGVSKVTIVSGDGSTPTTKTDVTLSFSSSSVTAGMRQSFTQPTLNARANGRNVSGLSYTYSSSNMDVATVDNNGFVTLNAIGTTVITANFAGNDSYNSATASYTLTVVATYKLTFMLDNEEFEIQYLKENDAITTPSLPYRSGYTYEWKDVPRRMPANDLVIYGFYIKLDQNITVSVGSTGYSTYCPTQPLRLMGTEDIKAYIAKIKSENEVKLSQVVGTVAAGTGLVLKGWSSNVTTQFEIAESGETYEDNLMVGVLSAVEIKSSDQYVLVDKDGIAKFADTGYNAAVVPAGKAYLQAPSSGSRILSITFEDDETTGITILPSMAVGQSSSYYNLGGQRVANPTKGLYIVNGKKTVFK